MGSAAPRRVTSKRRGPGIARIVPFRARTEPREPAGLGSLPITLTDAEVCGSLAAHHRDPFERMLVAQAWRLDAVVISRDPVFERYDVEAIRA